MAVTRPLTDAELPPEAAAVFAEIRATRGTEYVGNFWRALAGVDPALLAEVWGEVARRMHGPGRLDPLQRELIYIAVSIANGCSYCIHSHTAAARAKGMDPALHGEVLGLVALAMRTNALAQALDVPVDARFQAPE